MQIQGCIKTTIPYHIYYIRALQQHINGCMESIRGKISTVTQLQNPQSYVYMHDQACERLLHWRMHTSKSQ